MSRPILLAVVLILVAVGSVVFHFMSPWWWTPIASNWGNIDDTIIITFWITGVVFVAVILFMAYCVYKFHYKEDREVEYRPENHKLELWLTIGTTLGVVGLLTPGLFVWDDYVTVPEDAAEIEVLGQQWMWSYRLPGQDGVLGLTSARSINYDNPFGIDPDDPHGQDDIMVEGSEIHIPLNKPVKVLLRSIDVLHDFYVPEFRAKMDLVPGMVTYFWLTPTRTGTFDVMCFELCGVGHHDMRGRVVVEEQVAFDAWLAEQTTYAEYAATMRGGPDLALTAEVTNSLDVQADPGN